MVVPPLGWTAVASAAAMDVFRTPDERFAELPGYPYEPRYREWEGLRLAHIDEGSGPPVVMLHGEPTWGFLYRKLIPPLLEAGFRCVLPDLPGFGRSDKPTDDRWYSYDRHTAAVALLLEELELGDVTSVIQDWGGPIWLRIATTELPGRVIRLVAMDTGIFNGHQQMSAGWLRFRDFVARNHDLPIARLIKGACHSEPPPDVVAAYEAPFPSRESTAAIRGMVGAVAFPDDAEAVAASEAFYDRVRDDPRPMLILWAESDLFLTLASGQRLASRIGRQVDHVIPGAGHALQEDAGPEVGRLIAEWLGR